MVSEARWLGKAEKGKIQRDPIRGWCKLRLSAKDDKVSLVSGLHIDT